MAKNLDNSYVGDAAGQPDFTSGLSRTNPQAHAVQNAVKLYGMRKYGGCSFAPTWTWAITDDGETITFTPTAGYNATGLRYFKWYIIDGEGNEAFGSTTIPTNTAVEVDVSGLDPLKKWRIEFKAETLNSGLHCGAEWWLEIPAGAAVANPSGSGQDI